MNEIERDLAAADSAEVQQAEDRKSVGLVLPLPTEESKTAAIDGVIIGGYVGDASWFAGKIIVPRRDADETDEQAKAAREERIKGMLRARRTVASPSPSTEEAQP